MSNAPSTAAKTRAQERHEALLAHRRQHAHPKACPCADCRWFFRDLDVDPDGVLDYAITDAERAAAAQVVRDIVRPVSAASKPQGAPVTPVDARTPEQYLADGREWLKQLGRKVEIGDVKGWHLDATRAWLAGYTGNFDFLVDIKRRGIKTEGQAKGVLNCWRAAILRGDDWSATKTTTPMITAAPKAAKVPDGRYAVDNAKGILQFYKVNTPTEGKWAGFTFVGVFASDEVYPVRGAAGREILAKIAADVPAAAQCYAEETRRCSRCNHKLTVEASRHRGLGPECATK